MTLAKGMAYPAFIVAAFATGIPLKLVEQGLYLAAAGLTAWLVGRLTRSIWLAGILFGCLALNPVLWTAYLSRVLRDGIYISLSFAVMVLAAAVLLQQSALSVKTRVAFLLMLGLAGGSFWLNSVRKVCGLHRRWRFSLSWPFLWQLDTPIDRLACAARFPGLPGSLAWPQSQQWYSLPCSARSRV